jgi:phosphate:Na+ symporter
MVVGFVNSGVMVLKQAIGVIMGANLGTTVTAWILSLTGIQGDSLIVNLLKPTSFVPILALIGVIMYMFLKDRRKRTWDYILRFLGSYVRHGCYDQLHGGT